MLAIEEIATNLEEAFENSTDYDVCEVLQDARAQTTKLETAVTNISEFQKKVSHLLVKSLTTIEHTLAEHCLDTKARQTLQDVQTDLKSIQTLNGYKKNHSLNSMSISEIVAFLEKRGYKVEHV